MFHAKEKREGATQPDSRRFTLKVISCLKVNAQFPHRTWLSFKLFEPKERERLVIPWTIYEITPEWNVPHQKLRIDVYVASLTTEKLTPPLSDIVFIERRTPAREQETFLESPPLIYTLST